MSPWSQETNGYDTELGKKRREAYDTSTYHDIFVFEKGKKGGGGGVVFVVCCHGGCASEKKDQKNRYRSACTVCPAKSTPKERENSYVGKGRGREERWGYSFTG